MGVVWEWSCEVAGQLIQSAEHERVWASNSKFGVQLIMNWGREDRKVDMKDVMEFRQFARVMKSDARPDIPAL